MACRKITFNVGAIATRRQILCSPAAALCERRYSSKSKDEEIKTVTHTGQVFDHISECYANIVQPINFYKFNSISICRSSHRMTTETFDSQMPLVTWIRVLVRMPLCEISNGWPIHLKNHFSYWFNCGNTTERSDRSCGLLQRRRRTSWSSKSLHQLGAYLRRIGRFGISHSIYIVRLFQDKPGAHACNYCGLRFIKKDEHH